LDDSIKRLQTHIENFFPNQEKTEISWPQARILQYVPEFRIIEVAPRSRRDAWTYLTVGASEVTDEPATMLEFMILAPEENCEPVKILSMAAFNQTIPEYRLKIGDTVSIGGPWLDGSECDRFLVAVPYPYGPSFEWCYLDSRSVRFAWLVPITESEERFILMNSIELFEERLESTGVNVADPKRSSVA
jgi:Suppressor of fused protein (SUFU)